MTASRILLVDDEPRTTEIMRRMVEAIGCVALEVNDSTQALEAARAFRPNFALLDYHMPKLHGVDLAWQFASDPEFCDLTIAICSALVESIPKLRLPPREIGFFAKPISLPVLRQWLQEHHVAAAA